MAKSTKAAFVDEMREQGFVVRIQFDEGNSTWGITVDIDADRRLSVSHEDFEIALAMTEAALNTYNAFYQ